MRKLSKCSFLLVCLLIVFSCKKKNEVRGTDWIPLSQEECFPFEYEEEIVIADHYWEGIQYKYPCFNPDNSDEFVYVQQNGPSAKLIRYNWKTKEELQLAESLVITAQPAWSKSGWIFYTVAPTTVYRVHENGGAPIQVSLPSWEAINLGMDASQNNFVLHSNGSNMTNQDYYGIYNESGQLVDSIRWRYENIFLNVDHQSQNQHSNHLFFFGNTSTQEKGICKILNNTIHPLKILDASNYLLLTAAQNDTYLYYVYYSEGLYKLNKSSLEIEKIEDLCTARNIGSINVSNDGKFLLIERVKGVKEGGDGLYSINHTSEIYIYSIGLNKQKKILGVNW